MAQITISELYYGEKYSVMSEVIKATLTRSQMLIVSTFFAFVEQKIYRLKQRRDRHGNKSMTVLIDEKHVKFKWKADFVVVSYVVKTSFCEILRRKIKMKKVPKP